MERQMKFIGSVKNLLFMIRQTTKNFGHGAPLIIIQQTMLICMVELGGGYRVGDMTGFIQIRFTSIKRKVPFMFQIDTFQGYQK